jgi:hypothetical protein
LLKNIKINRHIERKNLVGQVIEKMCGEVDVKVEELRGGESEEMGGEAKAAYGLNREMGISMAEIARHLGVGASAIAMAIRKEEGAK